MVFASKASKKLEKYGIEKGWVAEFDVASPQRLKQQLDIALRGGVEELASKYAIGINADPDLSKSVLAEGNLPNNLTVGIVMTRGYSYAAVYGALWVERIAERFVLVGYSSGLHSKSKKFSDGSDMTEKVFITEHDLDILLRNLSAPMLFVEDSIQTGHTIATIGNTLKNILGYSGELYVMEDYECPKKWDVIVGASNKKTSALLDVVPIATETRVFTSLKREEVLKCH